MTGRLLLPILTALATLVTTACGGAGARSQPPAAGVSSVWVVEKGGHRIFIGGTIHLLREEDYPLPEAFEQAYRESTSLVFELPPGSEGDGEVVLRMRQMGSYGADEELGQHVEASTLNKVLAWADDNAFPRKAVMKMRPWFLALTIAALEYQKLGAESGRGVDQHFEARARQDGKPGAGLETVEFQLTIFSSLNDKLQEQLLLQTFSEAETLEQDFADLISAWKTGDAAKLQEYLFSDAEKYPGLMEDFLLKRNRNWIPALLKHLEKGDRVFVLVGAGHLGGKGGVLELLREAGCTVKQLDPAVK